MAFILLDSFPWYKTVTVTKRVMRSYAMREYADQMSFTKTRVRLISEVLRHIIVGQVEFCMIHVNLLLLFKIGSSWEVVKVRT
jgi:hypothetical protein